MISEYNILEWDSNFFGFNVAKIAPKKLDFAELRKILRNLKKRNVSLVYWGSDNTDKESQEAAKSLNGVPTGQKKTYILDLKVLNTTIFSLPPDVQLEKYCKKEPNSDLINLIIQGGTYSRFYIDPKINKKQYEDLHKLWIANSVEKNNIFVINASNKIIGFVSLNEKDKRGNIDFIVVDETYRGKGLGTALMNHAHNWFVSKDYEIVQADTQQENINACNMYEKLGYHIEKIENFYHFWL